MTQEETGAILQWSDFVGRRNDKGDEWFVLNKMIKAYI